MKDFFVNDQGTLVLITPLNDAARAWLKEHVQEDAQWFGRALVVEHRYANDLIEGILGEGFSI